MDGDKPDRTSGPRVVLAQGTTKWDGVCNCWSIEWMVENRGVDEVAIWAARLPHGQFKSEEQLFDPALELRPGEQIPLRTCVRCNEPPGPVTENAFVILAVNWVGEKWRIFVRLCVAVAEDGKPQTETELITAQKVGFSGVA